MIAIFQPASGQPDSAVDDRVTRAPLHERRVEFRWPGR